MPLDKTELPRVFHEYAADARMKLDEEKKETAWNDLKNSLKKYLEVASLLYPNRANDLKVDNMIFEVPKGMAPGKTDYVGYWDVEFDGKKMTCPQINIGGIDKLVLADGTMYSIERRRWGESDLKVDAKLHILSDETYGAQYPIFTGADHFGTEIEITNHDSRRKDENIYGLGRKLEIEGHSLKLEYSITRKDIPADVQKTAQDLRSSFEAKMAS